MSNYLAFFLGFAASSVVFVLVVMFYRRHQQKMLLDRAAENRVSTIAQVLHLAIQGAPTGVAVVNSARNVLLSNPSAHELGLVHERNLNAKAWDVASRVFSDQESREFDLTISTRRVGRPPVAVAGFAMPLTITDDRYVVLYASDESEQVRMEAARRDFVANVSHELKTPVGAMSLLVEALMEAKDDADSVEYFGGRLVRESKRLSKMITELISLSKLQGAEPLPDMHRVSVDDVVDEAVSRCQLVAENAGIEITADEPTGVYVRGDKALLATAVANLITNAINYSPEQTPVTVSRRIVDGDTVGIRVTDRGIGISLEDQKRVFERFFRVDKARSRATGGTGLGLAIVKHVAANHGGAIKLWSRPGTGSTFTLELPISDRDGQAVSRG
ncbi:sensor histidine kinase [Corynebacterium ulceribovis]|uniref:sensor histidine kinase n=1 Tax=Corynebacterium ulceribovis TaxID=487732 RepID=UPI0003A6B938